jgi:hypothetical protein
MAKKAKNKVENRPKSSFFDQPEIPKSIFYFLDFRDLAGIF